jgi:hypothetical protein
VRHNNPADAQDLFGSHERSFVAARDTGDEAAQAVFRLLGQVCSMVLRPSDPANSWQTLFAYADGTNSPAAEDFRGEQTSLLRIAAEKCRCVALRARLLDIAWCNNRRDGASAAAAVEAYCDIVDGLLAGSLTSSHGLHPSMAAETPTHRDLQIAWLTTKAESRPQRRCCRDRMMTWLVPYRRSSQVRRTEIGLAIRIMRLRTWTAIATSPACPSVECARSAEPMMCL